jgi:CheY-like chemotaxis protein
MSGFDVLILLKQEERTRLIPFIFSTAKSEPIDLQRARSLCVSNYLIKPFDGLELMECIRLTFNDTIPG